MCNASLTTLLTKSELHCAYIIYLTNLEYNNRILIRVLTIVFQTAITDDFTVPNYVYRH